MRTICLYFLLISVCFCCTLPKMAKSSKGVQWPVFQLPAPKPSAFYTLPVGHFAGAQNLGDINSVLAKALDVCGYTEKSYYYVEDGFAVVTRLEKINRDGTPKQLGRFDLNDTRSTFFTLTDYLHSLFYAQPGYYRCIVFLVTPVDFNLSGKAPTRSETSDWLNEGLVHLPMKVKNMKFSKEHTITALVYEFKKLENSLKARIIVPSDKLGLVHLQKANIIKSLGL